MQAPQGVSPRDDAPADDLRAGLEPVGDLDGLGRAWRGLESRADGSFFQSWSWIGVWLRSLPETIVPQVLSVRAGGDVVGLGIVVRRRVVRHRVLAADGLFLNETGDPAFDHLTLEYNGLLRDRRYADAVEAAAFRFLAGVPGWDEVYVSGVVGDARSACEAAARRAGLGVRLIDLKPCDCVDLDAVRAAGGDYVAGLSRNSRQQLRRAMRGYEDDGPLGLDVAADADEALAFFAEMKTLHQAYWTGRGRPGAFANPFFEAFHARLIAERHASGEIQMLRVRAGAEAIGYLYNFVGSGVVHAYQSGFLYDDDAKRKPGVVSHALAIERNLAEGRRIYDFMAGEARHKKSLGTASQDMAWLVFQRDRLKLRAETALRRVRRWAKSRVRS